MGGIGAVAEPLVVISLLIGGTWINRTRASPRRLRQLWPAVKRVSEDDVENVTGSDALLEQHRSMSPSLLTLETKWRKRTVRIWGVSRKVSTPNTRRFRGRLLSRLLQKLPFLVECWYWALIYWVYQLGRAATAVFIVEDTVLAARDHALSLIRLEERLHIFTERYIQEFVLQSPTTMHWINRVYSFIHIPGSIAFLIWLFYITHTQRHISTHAAASEPTDRPIGPHIYQARRRTMALCNLLAFTIFTLHPLMPPRLLSADETAGWRGDLARSYGFIDTVHGSDGESSVWTQNKFCNQYAAMPSLHFGYSLLIGLTIMTIPLASKAQESDSAPGPHREKDDEKIVLSCRIPGFNRSIPKHTPRITIKLPKPTYRLNWRRVVAVVVGVAYPSLILVAILATANHFILDAVAGACVCGVAWWGNRFMLNLLVVEDYFLWLVRIHKPEGPDEEDVPLENWLREEDDDEDDDDKDYDDPEVYGEWDACGERK